MIKQLIEIEMGYINNNHPDFIQTLTSVQSQQKKGQEKEQQSEQGESNDFRFIEESRRETNTYHQPKKKNQMQQLKNEVELYDSKIFSSKDKKGSKEENEKEEPSPMKPVQTGSLLGSSGESTNYLQLADIYNISKVMSHFPR